MATLVIHKGRGQRDKNRVIERDAMNDPREAVEVIDHARERQRQSEEFNRKAKPKKKERNSGIGDGPRKKEFRLKNLRYDEGRQGSDPKSEADRVASIVKAGKLHGRDHLVTEIAIAERKLGTLRAALEILDAEWPDQDH